MLRLTGIKLRPGQPRTDLLPALCGLLRISQGDVKSWRISRESVDARHRDRIRLVFSVDVELEERLESRILARTAGKDSRMGKVLESSFALPAVDRMPVHRPVVCGFGPCGIFAALIFARMGLNPIVLERGPSMEERIRAVAGFWDRGELDPSGNVQFGEGGAGTFSDGKLTTGTSDPVHRFILAELAAAGAPRDILFRQKPHVGTDLLRKVVVNLRRTIQAAGGEVRFNTRMEHPEICEGALKGVALQSGEILPADTLVLALGHSARDSFRQLHSQGLAMAQKPFSIGVRVEHLQRDIDLGRYGQPAADVGLPPAEYKLALRTSKDRGVYTFCMCPGGYVVASASEEGGVVTNGMSFRSRDGRNANGAVLVDVYPSDFSSEHPLAGIAFQEIWERKAWELGGRNYHAPAERLGDFLGVPLPAAPEEGAPMPTYRPGVAWARVEECLPPFASEALREAFPGFGRMLPGFDHPLAVLTAPESRSSSPVRILRNEKKEALDVQGRGIKGLYPAGEGAGYAGGILSAAADGIHSALAALRSRE